MSDGAVLIVDPDVEARARYEVALARAGFSVVSAGDGTAALRLASRLVPDGLLTEILLPNLDGFHLAQRLRKQPKTRGIGIVAVTGYDGDDLNRRAAESGIDAVVPKGRPIYEVIRAMGQTMRNNAGAKRRSIALCDAVGREIDRGRELRDRAEDVLAQSREVAAAIARAIGDEHLACIDEEMLAQADGAREVMIVDRARGEALFEVLLERYHDHPVLHYKRGEAYRATGRRKLAHREFMLAADRLPDGLWRDRARFAAMRTRSHHERAK